MRPVSSSPGPAPKPQAVVASAAGSRLARGPARAPRNRAQPTGAVQPSPATYSRMTFAGTPPTTA